MKRDSGTHCDRSGETRHMFTHERPSDGDGGTAAATSKESAGRWAGVSIVHVDHLRVVFGLIQFPRHPVAWLPMMAREGEEGEEEFRSSVRVRPRVRAAARESIIWSGALQSASRGPFAISLAPQTVHHTPTAQNCSDQSAEVLGETVRRPSRHGAARAFELLCATL